MIKIKKESVFWVVVAILFVGSVIGYKIGYNEAVKRAELVNSSDAGYTISYDGQLHEYEF